MSFPGNCLTCETIYLRRRLDGFECLCKLLELAIGTLVVTMVAGGDNSPANLVSAASDCDATVSDGS